MENLYIVNEYEDYGEYCYIVKADTIGKALSIFIERQGIVGYELKNNNEKNIEGVTKDEEGLTWIKFRISPLEFDTSNVIFIGGYSE